MTKRRCWIAGLVIGALGVALLVGVLNSRSGPPDVQILLVGYTNVFPRFPSNWDWDSQTNQVERAVLLVTNCSSVTVRVLPLWEAFNRTNMDAHRRSYVLVWGQTLKPGESIRTELRSGLDQQMLRAEVAYHLLNFRHELSKRVRSSTNALSRAAAKLLPRQPKMRWAYSEPLTNSPARQSDAYSTATLPKLSYAQPSPSRVRGEGTESGPFVREPLSLQTPSTRSVRKAEVGRRRGSQ